jgi:C1A family cysteine protease
MAIRVVRDEDAPEDQNVPQPGGGGGNRGGGGGMIGALLPILLGLFGKNPKLLILVVIVAGAFYFFKGGCSMPSESTQQNSTALSTGAQLDAKQFDATEVFESLSSINNLPERVSLEKFCPPRLNQGQQGSCVAWSHAYAARSIMYNMQTGQAATQNNAFSPAFLYNQIKLDGCQGSYIPRAMEKMQNQGLVPFNDFEYNEQDCNRQPNENLKQKANSFKIKGFQRLTLGDKTGVDNEKIDMQAIKQNLAQGAPVTIGMMVGGTFMQEMMGREVWMPTEDDYNMSGFGGHAMCIIGYDDYKAGGAFQIMNSWGNDWGKNGIGWVRYKDFEYFNKEAYGLYPMGAANDPKFAPNHLQASFGLVDNETKQTIPLSKQSEISFRATTPLKRGKTKFKIQVTNDAECYTYLYGLEADNSIKGLFPYTPKHSPYCGIMGTRLFPRDYSLQPDETGSLDYFAIIVSKQPIDFEGTKAQLSKASGSFEQKIKTVFSGKLSNTNFTANNVISFNLEGSNNQPIVAMIIEVPKS